MLMPNKRRLAIQLCVVLSGYVFIQCTLFVGTPAHFLYSHTFWIFKGGPVSFSPYDLIPYLNFVFKSGLLISGILFITAATAYIKPRLKDRFFMSILLAFLMTPIYFIVLFLGARGIIAFFT